MAGNNFDAFLAFVWRPGFDDPNDGCHITPHDTGGTTNGGVIQATWDHACKVGIVEGKLPYASRQQLADVLRATCWYPIAEAVPAGLDLLLANGCMMTGAYPHLVQQCLGLTGAGVDGWIGPQTLGRIALADTVTLINALSGVHYAYLTRLPTWPDFGRNWTKRVTAAQAEALRLHVPAGPSAGPPASPPAGAMS